ncbi:MAG: hypothetical protein IKK43_03565 [Clostridia bacterium]|nr:hypothetical protein [Clostridia bacterium]
MEERKEEVMSLVQNIQEIFGKTLPIWFNLDEKGCVINIKVGKKNLCMVTEWYDELWYCASSNEKIDNTWFDQKIEQDVQHEDVKYIMDTIVKCGIKSLSEKVMYLVATPESEKIEDALGTYFIDCFRTKELPILLKEYVVNEMLDGNLGSGEGMIKGVI